jgi:hypothetical protein
LYREKFCGASVRPAVYTFGGNPKGMSILESLLRRFGLGEAAARRPSPIRVFLLDDDTRRHEWFAKRFKGDELDVAVEPLRAIEMLDNHSYDVIFLDHDLLPEHYGAEEFDDERTGFAVALWLAAHPERQPASSIWVHTRNGDAAMRMVEELRRSGRQAEYVPFHMLAPKIKNYWKR